MKEYIICKSCGYIMEKSGLKDKCPACGVPAKMFDNYVEKVSEKRKFILSLDIHPILVHFSIAFSFSIFLMSIAAMIISGILKNNLIAAIYILSLCLPFTVIFSFFAGILDGNIRFKRVTTPILIRKIILGTIFFILSVTIFILNITSVSEYNSFLILSALLSAGCLICDFLLGILGKSLLNAKFPG